MALCLDQSKTMNYRITLASGSPRRQALLQQMGVAYTTRIIPVSEVYPAQLPVDQVAAFLAEKKGKAYQAQLAEDELVITADTTVVVDEVLLNKPADATEARRMLRQLSGRGHRVVTGVCLTRADSRQTFEDTTEVYFRPLSDEMIHFYVKEYQPYDKAGGYAIQEWIGMVGIERINGSYFNVVGLPTEKLYLELQQIGAVL